MDWLARQRVNLLVIALAVAEAVALVASDHAGRYLAAGLAAAAALVLLARRPWPLPVSVLALALFAGSLVAAPKSPSVQFFGLMATFAVAAAINTTRDGVIAWVIGALLVGAATARADTGNAVGDFALTLAFCTVMWAAGWLISRHTRRADVMTLRASAAEQAQAIAVSAERARIARELHDVVSHGLSVVALQTLAARSALVDRNGAELERHLDAVESAARDALGEMRRMLDLLDLDVLDSLTPEPAAPSPGLRHLTVLVERARGAGLDIDDSAVDEVAGTSAGFELTLYRIVQEALTNAAKHAPGAHVTLALHSDADSVQVTVTNDGGTGGEPRLAGCRPRAGRDARAGRPLPGHLARFAVSGSWVHRLGDAAHRGLPRAGGARLIRVLLADDQALIRDGFRSLIDREADLQVVAEAADGVEAIALVRQHQPDVVLMDIRMPRIDGLAATRQVLATPTPPRVLVLTTFDRNEWVFQALRAGASGFLLKDVRASQLTDAIRTVAGGESLLAPAITTRLIEHFVSSRSAALPAQPPDVLTERETDVLRLIATGRSNAEIAQQLVIGQSTVKTHVNRLLTKLDLRDRTQAVVYAYEHRVVAPRANPAPEGGWARG